MIGCMKRTSARHPRQRGVSIVEALVALVVLSVGMLGIAGMYLLSVQSNRSAKSRTLAVHLVNDMADRIRANRMARGAYSVTLGTEPKTSGTGWTNCTTTDCTPAQLATWDLGEWFKSVKDTLPQALDKTNPKISITFTAGGSSKDADRYVIQAQWKEPGDAEYLSTQLEVLQLGDQA